MLKQLLSFTIIGSLCAANPLTNVNDQGSYSELELFWNPLDNIKNNSSETELLSAWTVH